jgi:peptidoglycan/xylan/chitin deacetylase (PgdA/CDA1 family)
LAGTCAEQEVDLPSEHSRTWRQRLKAALAPPIAGARAYGVAAAFARGANRPLILGYHRVVENFESEARSTIPSMLVSRAMLERHLDCIGRDFRFVSLDEIADHLTEGRPFTEPVAAVTFDDGYREVYEHAAPILLRKGIPAAVFVVTDLVGKPYWYAHDKLYHLIAKAFAMWADPARELTGLLDSLDLPVNGLCSHGAADPVKAVSVLLPSLPMADLRRLMNGLEASVGNGFCHVPRTLTWPMIAALRHSGFTIGSHSRSHASLPAESPESLAEELEGSKRELEHQLRAPVRHFAYPGGQFTPPVVEAVVTAGYQFAYTACPHSDRRHPTLTQERLILWERSSVDADGEFLPSLLDCQTHDLWPPARRCGRTHRP